MNIPIKIETIKKEEIVYDLPPAILLTFLLYIILDMITNGAISSITNNLWIGISAFSIATLIILLTHYVLIVYPIFSLFFFIHPETQESIIKNPIKNRNKNLARLAQFCISMILPSILFGIFFPVFIDATALLLGFIVVFTILAFLFLILGYVNYSLWYRTNDDQTTKS